MKLFNFIQNILRQIQTQDVLIDLKPLQKQENLLILRYIPEKGMEQDIIAKELQIFLDKKIISETFFGYLLWISGEIMNNIFDHGQTLGKTLKGGILAMNIKNNTAHIVIGDLGIGIQASLEKNPKLQAQNLNPKKAIKLALTEHTSGWPQKRGNGLPDVLRIIKAGNGSLKIYSDQTLFKIKNSNKKYKKINKKLLGVTAGIKLRIKDFQVPSRDRIKGMAIKLSQFGKQLSGREKGQEAYETLIKKITSLPKEGILIIDLTGIIMMNSSFGDQAIGVLLENIQAGHFGSKKVLFTGEIKQVVDLCLNRISEIRNVKIDKI